MQFIHTQALGKLIPTAKSALHDSTLRHSFSRFSNAKTITFKSTTHGHNNVELTKATTKFYVCTPFIYLYLHTDICTLESTNNNLINFAKFVFFHYHTKQRCANNSKYEHTNFPTFPPTFLCVCVYNTCLCIQHSYIRCSNRLHPTRKHTHTR